MQDFLKDKKVLFEFLSENRIYPYVSRKGKVFLRYNKTVFLSGPQKKEILTLLNIRSAEECKKIRGILREQAEKANSHTPIKEWTKSERPREMLLREGSDKLPLSKLFAIILGTGNVGNSAEDLAIKLLNKFKTLRNLNAASTKEICEIEGIGIAKAAQIKAALEIGNRLMRENTTFVRKIRTSREAAQYVYEYFGPYLRDAKKEFFVIVLLDARNKPIKQIEISKGTINSSAVDPKDIVKEAMLNSASAVILAHNHPSGDTEPSEEDIAITDRIKNACELVNIRVIDHIILGRNFEDYFSFSSAKLI